MATKGSPGGPMTGLGAALASLPLAATPLGGIEFGPQGVSGTPAPTAGQAQPDTPPGQSGPLFTDDPHTLWQTCENLRLRQMLVWKNHLAQDTHWSRVKLGYPWSTLEKDDSRDVYRCSLPPGVHTLAVQAVPNILWDQIRKCTATLLADFPKARCQPLTTSEDAERAAAMAEQFLQQDGGPDAMDDESLFYTSLERSLTCASVYHRYWVDQTGGGYVPLQVKAHPMAQDPANPFTLADGTVATPAEAVERYVTPADPTTGQRQFAPDGTTADQMWLPRIRVDRLGREHVCVFPESEPVQNADQVLITYYCTVAEGRRRWPDTVGQMADEDIAQLCDWTPPQYLPLLPLQLRARWKLQVGDGKRERSGSNDQRLFFFYSLYQRDVPGYPQGAELHVSGAFDGVILGRETLALPMKAPGQGPEAPGQASTRCRDLPLVQLTPVADPDDRDPSGRAYAELFGGAAEYAATLATHFLEKVDTILHAEGYIPGMSPVQGTQREEARATGDLIPVNTRDDLPFFAEQPPLPPGFLDIMNWGLDQIQSIAALPKPLVGADNQQEVSGKARIVAVQQGQIGLGPMSANVNSAVVRHYRIKLQLAQANFPVPLQIRYVGEDGAYKQEAFEAADFALVGEVQMAPNTGTMMTPEQKVNQAATAMQAGLLDADTAKEIARTVFTDTLGADADPHGERAERCLTAWLKGPPPEVQQAFAQYQQQLQAYQAQGPQLQQMQAVGQPAPPMPQPPQVPPQANPFQPRANDTDPAIAAVWTRILSRAMSTVRYAEQPDYWQAVLNDAYGRFRNALAQAQAGATGPADMQNFQAFKTKIDQLAQALIEKTLAADVATTVTPNAAPPAGPAAGMPGPSTPRLLGAVA